MTATAPKTMPSKASAPAKAAPAPVETKAPATEVATPAVPAEKFAEGVPKLGEPIDTKEPVPQLGDEVKEPEPAAEPEAEAKDEKPIEYDFTPKEGDKPYREPILKGYTDLAQKHKLAPDVAKDVLETMAPLVAADLDAQVKERIAEQTQTWTKDLQARHGEKLGDVMRLANQALAHGASKELTTFLRDSALAVNPDFIDMLAHFGQRVTSDRSVQKSGLEAPPGPRDPIAEAAAEYDRNDKTRGN